MKYHHWARIALAGALILTLCGCFGNAAASKDEPLDNASLPSPFPFFYINPVQCALLWAKYDACKRDEGNNTIILWVMPPVVKHFGPPCVEPPCIRP